jgi:hypothetical protein
MATISVKWHIEVLEDYEAELEVPENMTAEEFIDAISSDPDAYLAELETEASYVCVNERAVESTEVS